MGTQHTRSDSYTYSSGPSIVQVPCIVPVAPYGACETAWDRREQPVVAVCGVVPGVAIVPLIPSIVHIQALQRKTKNLILFGHHFQSPAQSVKDLCTRITTFFSFSFGSSLLVSSSIRQTFTLSDLLDKPSSQVTSPLPPGTRLHFYRGYSSAFPLLSFVSSSNCVDVFKNSRSRAFPSSNFPQGKVPTSTSMH